MFLSLFHLCFKTILTVDGQDMVEYGNESTRWHVQNGERLERRRDCAGERDRGEGDVPGTDAVL